MKMKNSDAPSKSDNRYTQQSQLNSQDGYDFNRGFQFNLLPIPKPNKQKINKFQTNFKSELKIRQPDDIKKPSITVPMQPSNNNLLSVNQTKQENQASFIDIKISNYPSNSEVNSYKQVKVHQNINNQKSFQNLPSSGRIESSQLKKSQTQPTIVNVKDYEGFQIKTNYVQQQRNFKRQKNQSFSVYNSNSNMTFLNAMVSPKNSHMHASRVINDTRITLKDYLFMANTSSNQAAEAKRKELKQSKNFITQPSNISKKTNQSSMTSNISIRQRFHKQKYHIGNTQMGKTVKQSVTKELISLQAKIQTINQWMNSHNNIENQQLIQLYNIRRQLQNYNKNLEQSFIRLNINQTKQYVDSICDMSIAQHQNDQQIESDIDLLGQI